MKKLIYSLFVFVFFTACQEDDAGFDTDMLAENISFKPIAGGAIMHYKLPDDDEVFSLKVRYTDAEGNEVLREGSYACDSILIAGFNEARQGVEARVTLCNRQNVESKSMIVSFDTQDSGPVAFFNTAKIEPYWNGFSVVYEGSKNANGFAHVLFVGKTPQNQKIDTLLLKTFQIGEGADTLHFSLAYPNPENTVVVRTEDYRGYMVKQQVWTNIESYSIGMLDPVTFDFLDPAGVIVENETSKYGKEYLFDGDTKGEKSFGLGTRVFSTFLAGPKAKGKPFIVDFKGEETPAFIRVYGMLNVKSFFHLLPEWTSGYTGALPSTVSVYVSNDKDNDTSWVKWGYYTEPVDAPHADKWCLRCVGFDNAYSLKELSEIQAAEPCYITINLPAREEKWRYMKIVVDEIFGNANDYVTFNELEIYAKTK